MTESTKSAAHCWGSAVSDRSKTYILHYRLTSDPGHTIVVPTVNNHAMRAFEIYINGERLYLAGVSNASFFTAIIEYLGRDEEQPHWHVDGLLIILGEIVGPEF